MEPGDSAGDRAWRTEAIQNPSPAGPSDLRAATLAATGTGAAQVPGWVEVVAKFFRALGDPARLWLLGFLLDTEHTVTECVTYIGLSQGRVSAHLGCLADCGYVEARRRGRNVFYRVADPRVADLVLLARSMAADNTAALAACMRIGPAPGNTQAPPGDRAVTTG